MGGLLPAAGWRSRYRTGVEGTGRPTHGSRDWSYSTETGTVVPAQSAEADTSASTSATAVVFWTVSGLRLVISQSKAGCSAK